MFQRKGVLHKQSVQDNFPSECGMQGFFSMLTRRLISNLMQNHLINTLTFQKVGFTVFWGCLEHILMVGQTDLGGICLASCIWKPDKCLSIKQSNVTFPVTIQEHLLNHVPHPDEEHEHEPPNINSRGYSTWSLAGVTQHLFKGTWAI